MTTIYLTRAEHNLKNEAITNLKESILCNISECGHNIDEEYNL